MGDESIVMEVFMKYLKCSILIFVVALICSSFGVGASQIYHYANITIPRFKGTWVSPEHIKQTSSYQYAKKTGCVDDVSGDGRVIIGKTYKKTGSGPANSSWKEVTYSGVNWGTENNYIYDTYSLWLQSNKSLATTASFTGSWTVDQ